MKKTIQKTQNTQNTTCTTDKKEGTAMLNATNTANTANINDFIKKTVDIATKAADVMSAMERTFRMARANQGFLDTQELVPEFKTLLRGAVTDEDVARGANVILTGRIPQGLEAHVGERLIVAWGANPKYNPDVFTHGIYPNILWVNVKPMNRPEKPMIEKAVAFFGLRVPDMPEAVVRELFEAGWDGEEVTLCVHPSAKPVVLKAQAGGGQYLLQVPDEKGNFVPNKPIAYQTGNRIYVSIPGTQYGRRWTFGKRKPAEQE